MASRMATSQVTAVHREPVQERHLLRITDRQKYDNGHGWTDGFYKFADLATDEYCLQFGNISAGWSISQH